ncbi:MAG TPA: MCE family protein [Marmoricola sp.]|nr:MCE family protein [Marmoricola sp.]HRV69170.1 MCE family protein [Marmoricola sp.]
MAVRSDQTIMRLGAVALVGLLIAMAAAFNLQKFPGFKGTDYHANFADASGLRVGNIVQVAGVKVGRVNDIRITGGHVTVDFDAKDVKLGSQTTASVQVLNLLGEKYLEIGPEGSGLMKSNATIPLSRTSAGYDIVSTLSTVTTRTEAIDTEQLGQALTTLGETIDAASPEVRGTLNGLSRVSQTLALRDENIAQLLKRAESVTELLSQRRGDLVTLMKQADLVFKELKQREQALHRLITEATNLGDQLQGLVTDNQDQIRPALTQLRESVAFLKARKVQIRNSLHNLGPYVDVLSNVMGSGPWFDSYLPNMAGLLTGEFVPVS